MLEKIEDTIHLFISLRQLFENGEANRYFVNPLKLAMPQRTIFSANESVGINFIIADTENASYQFVGFHEESITAAFIDFISSIDESGLVYSTEESIAVLDSIIGNSFEQ